MNRTTIRKHTFLILFRAEFHEESELKEQSELYFKSEETAGISEEDADVIKERAALVQEHLTEIDEKISQISEGWDISRLGKVELSIIRLACFEIMFDELVPTSVAINEAVELAKKYGGDDSPSFVNGILAKLV